MSNHTTTIVPLESWSYASPEVREIHGKTVDIGLFAEALIYYDCTIANITNPPQLAEFLQWFIAQGQLDDFLALVRDGTVKFYDYAFATAAIQDGHTGHYSICNIQDPLQSEPDTFDKRFLFHETIERLLPHARQRHRLYEALRGRVIEVKATDFGDAIENARQDYQDPNRNTLILQAFIDEIYHMRNLGRPPKVQATVQYSADRSQNHITWNINFNELKRIAGPKLNFSIGTPLTAAALSNRLILSAARLSCDLYLPQPMSMVVGDKLYESAERMAKTGAVIQELKARVEFPDVRTLVNAGKINFQEILRIRKEAKKFRDWLQQGADRDRDAIIAYHNETARELGIIKGARKTLNIFGILSAGAIGSLLGSTIAGPVGGAIGAAAGSAITGLADVGSKIGAEWKPVVFGNWLRQRIEKFAHEADQN